MMRQKVYSLVKSAISNGVLTRPLSCQKCGDFPSPAIDGRSRIHAHHHDYMKPLDVQWLCAKCHRKETPFPENPGGVSFGDKNGMRTKPESRPFGEKNGYAKLTSNDVLIIKKIKGSSSDVASLFNVAPSTIRDIRIGRTWKWLTESHDSEDIPAIFKEQAS